MVSSAVRASVWAALLFLGVPSAFAVDLAAQDTTQVLNVQGIRVQVPRPATTAGGSSAVEVSLDSIRGLAAPTMEELLRRMPLVQIRANSRGEAQPNLRGAEDRQIAVLLDGIPLTLGWDHRTDLSIIPLTAVRNLTILRGLSSMLHGPNVLGGALEFDVARGPQTQNTPPPSRAAVSVDQEAGVSVDAVVGTMLERDFSTFVVRAGAGYRDRPGVPLPGDATSTPSLRPQFLADNEGLRLNSDRRQLDGFVSTRYRGIGGSWLSALATAYSAERGVPPESHVDDPRLWRYPDQARGFLAVSGGTGERATAHGSGDLEFSFGLDRSTLDIDEFGSEAYQTIVDGESGETTTMTGRLLGDHTLGTGGEVRTAVTFSNVGHDEAFQDGTAFEYQQRLWSLGGEVELSSGGWFGLGDQGETHWTLGVAMDGSSTPKSGDKPPIETLWDWGIRGGATTGGGDRDLSYHVGFSRRTRFPSLRELYSGALGRFEPNPELRPENLKAGEAGVTWSGPRGRIQLVGFHHRLSEGIVRTSVTTPEGPRFRRVNRDQVRSTGIEFLASGESGPLSYGGDVTLQRVRISDPLVPDADDRAEYEPAVASKVNLGFLGPAEILISGFLRYRGTQLCENPESGGLDDLASSTTVDFELRRRFSTSGARGRTFDGAIGFDNVSDATVFDQCGLPQPGRTLRLQVSVF
ncbi:MAG: TonB-dependent receptor plug domain-containing protein [Longimicrobiales bacterium]